MSKVEIVMAGLAIIGIAFYEFLSGDAIFVANRKRDPVEFWIALVIHTIMGLFAIVYGLFK